MDPISKIREKSREQWFELLKCYVDDIRIWIEDNGVKASALALVFGMVIILFFKVIVFISVMAILVAFFVWSVAMPESEVGKHPSTSSTNGHEKVNSKDERKEESKKDNNDKTTH